MENDNLSPLTAAQCAYINFLNMVRVMPEMMYVNPLFAVTRLQMRSVIEMMDKNGRDFCDNQDRELRKSLNEPLLNAGVV